MRLRELRGGHKVWAYLPVAGYASGVDCIIPVMIVSGSRPGRVLCVTAGVHGDEYEGPVAIRRTWHALDPAQLTGVYVGIPHLNVPAFEAGSRTNSIDHLNLNRICPGNPNGFLTERIAHAFFEHICPQIDNLVDLHGGGVALDIAPLAVYREIGDAGTVRAIREFAESCGTRLLWKGVFWPGASGGTLTQEASNRGVHAISVEMGGRGVLNPDLVRADEQIIRNCLYYLGMLDGVPSSEGRPTVVEGSFTHVRHGGLFSTTVRLLDRVHEHQVVGEVEDIFGEVRERVLAPYDGIVVSHRSFPTILPGDWAVFIGRVVG
jgi:hypothetical protein